VIVIILSILCVSLADTSSMPAIVTITTNPALDISTSTETVGPTEKLRCGPPRYDPGGGGINVARVVRILGGDVTTVFPAGGASGQAFHDLLDRDGVAHEVVPIREPTRESFTVEELRSGHQYRFVLPGPSLSEAEQKACLDRLSEVARGARFIVGSGSLAPGIGPDFYARVGQVAHAAGARFILDTSGEALRQAGQGVYLVKPSIRELRDLVGDDLSQEAEQIRAARGLIEEGRAQVVVLSLGAQGAFLVTIDSSERLLPIKVPLRSAVGAGDTMVAAITLALVRGLPLLEAVRFGMAAGAATLMTPGTELCRRDDVERLYGRTFSSERPKAKGRL
jgi:6-phosphofructokinase 2